MGRDLYYTIPLFFENKMREHACVSHFRRIDAEELIYEISRDKFDDTLKVWLSDAYLFTELDFDNRPFLLKRGDYILIARPEAGHSVSKELVKSVGIGVGKIKELMGSLNRAKVWTYSIPER